VNTQMTNEQKSHKLCELHTGLHEKKHDNRLSESICFSDDETTAGIWCLVWDPLIAEVS